MRRPSLRRPLIAVVVLVMVLVCGAAAAVAVGGGIVKVHSTTISGNGFTVIVHRTVTDGHTIGAVESMTEIVGQGTATRSLTRTLTIGRQRPVSDRHAKTITATRPSA